MEISVKIWISSIKNGLWTHQKYPIRNWHWTNQHMRIFCGKKGFWSNKNEGKQSSKTKNWDLTSNEPDLHRHSLDPGAMVQQECFTSKQMPTKLLSSSTLTSLRYPARKRLKDSTSPFTATDWVPLKYSSSWFSIPHQGSSSVASHDHWWGRASLGGH